MFGNLINAVNRERFRLEEQNKWLTIFKETIKNLDILEDPWQENQLIYQIPTSIPKTTRISGVDGGVISEAMTGFDLILYRAVAATFSGIGEKVNATYIPSFDPEPRVFFSPSLPSRNEFQRLSTLLRLYAEYEVAHFNLQGVSPTVLFIDGKVMPLASDFIGTSSKLITQIEEDVKNMYLKLVRAAVRKQVLLCGIVKDSRSREYVNRLNEYIPYLLASKKLQTDQLKGWRYIFEEMQDVFFGESFLNVGERTAWLETSIPEWFDIPEKVSVFTCLIKPIKDDMPVRFEMIVPENWDNFSDFENIALGAYTMLCNHGLPLALPTVILEADDRTKMNNDHLHSVIDQISISLGIPKEQLRKRRYFTKSLNM